MPDPDRQRSRRIDTRLVAYGATAIVVGVVIALLVDQPGLRFVGSVTAIVIGFGLLRQAFRIE